MNFIEFLADAAIQAAAAAYTAAHGGAFVCEEPGDRLMYETENGEHAYTPPDRATAAQVLKALQSGKPLPELWPELEYDPDALY